MVQERLVALDRERVVGAAFVQVVRVRTLSMQRIGGDHHPAQILDAVQQHWEAGDLVRLGPASTWASTTELWCSRAERRCTMVPPPFLAPRISLPSTATTAGVVAAWAQPASA